MDRGGASGRDRAASARRSRARVPAAVLVSALGLGSLATNALGGWGAKIRYSDFLPDYVSARAWSEGRDPFAPTLDLSDRYVGRGVIGDFTNLRNPHTPAQIVLVRPLSHVPYRTARTVWLLAMASSIAVAVGASARALGAARGTAVALGLGALALPTTRLDLGGQQSNSLIALLLVIAWLSLRAGNDRGAGAALGLATALKVIPLLLVVPLVRMRRARAVAWQLGVATGVTVLAAALLGLSAIGRYATDVLPDNTDYFRPAGHNISLPAIPFRWLTENHWFPGRAHLPAAAAVLAVALAAACLLAAARTPARASGDLFWAAVPWMILAAPLAWADYLVMVYPLLLVMLRGTHGSRSPPLVLFGILGAVLGRPMFVFFVHPVGVVEQALVLSLPMYALLALAVVEWSGRGRGAGLPGERAFGVYPAEGT